MTPRLVTFDLDDTLWDVAPVMRGAEATLRDWLASQAPRLGPLPIEQLWAIRGQLLEAEPLLRFRLSELRRRILLQALRSAGASQLQIIAFGVVPQVITAWIAVVLYRFEVNLRSATVLGMVGAGGLGFELVSSLKLFRYQETATCIIVITVMVIAADMASNWLRSRIQQGARH